LALKDVRPYFRTALNGLGFSEWDDAFNYENVPDTIIDKSYHLGTISSSNVVMQQRKLSYTASINVKVFFKGFREPKEALDEAMIQGDNILAAVLKPSTRNAGATLKNVNFDSLEAVPMDVSNDNVVRLEIGFTCDLLLPLEEGI